MSLSHGLINLTSCPKVAFREALCEFLTVEAGIIFVEAENTDDRPQMAG
jgi:hypothetical protein